MTGVEFKSVSAFEVGVIVSSTIDNDWIDDWSQGDDEAAEDRVALGSQPMRSIECARKTASSMDDDDSDVDQSLHCKCSND